MDLCQIRTEHVFGPSLRQVEMSRSKVKGQGYQGQKTRCALTTPPQYGRNGTASLQITSHEKQAGRFDRCRGVSSPACVVRALGLTGYAGLCHAFLVKQNKQNLQLKGSVQEQHKCGFSSFEKNAFKVSHILLDNFTSG